MQKLNRTKLSQKEIFALFGIPSSHPSFPQNLSSNLPEALDRMAAKSRKKER
jgi:hypothetical protein